MSIEYLIACLTWALGLCFRHCKWSWWTFLVYSFSNIIKNTENFYSLFTLSCLNYSIPNEILSLLTMRWHTAKSMETDRKKYLISETFGAFLLLYSSLRTLTCFDDFRLYYKIKSFNQGLMCYLKNCFHFCDRTLEKNVNILWQLSRKCKTCGYASKSQSWQSSRCFDQHKSFLIALQLFELLNNE